MKSYVESLGLDTAAFNECLAGKKFQPRVNEDLASDAKLGVSGTPGFVIGLTDSDDPEKSNMKHFIRGAQSLDNFKSTIDGLLATAE